MRKKIYYFISVFLIILIPTILTEIYLKYRPKVKKLNRLEVELSLLFKTIKK